MEQEQPGPEAAPVELLTRAATPANTGSATAPAGDAPAVDEDAAAWPSPAVSAAGKLEQDELEHDAAILGVRRLSSPESRGGWSQWGRDSGEQEGGASGDEGRTSGDGQQGCSCQTQEDDAHIMTGCRVQPEQEHGHAARKQGAGGAMPVDLNAEDKWSTDPDVILERVSYLQLKGTNFIEEVATLTERQWALEKQVKLNQEANARLEDDLAALATENAWLQAELEAYRELVRHQRIEHNAQMRHMMHKRSSAELSSPQSMCTLLARPPVSRKLMLKDENTDCELCDGMTHQEALLKVSSLQTENRVCEQENLALRQQVDLVTKRAKQVLSAPH